MFDELPILAVRLEFEFLVAAERSHVARRHLNGGFRFVARSALEPSEWNASDQNNAKGCNRELRVRPQTDQWLDATARQGCYFADETLPAQGRPGAYRLVEGCHRFVS